MEPKKLTQPQVKLMFFLYKNKKRHTREEIIKALGFNRNLLSISIMPLAGYFIKVDKQKTKISGRPKELITLTEAGKISIKAWMLANA